MSRVRIWGWWRRSDSSAGEISGEDLSASDARDELLSAYIDGELDSAQAAGIEDALEADPDLAAELDELRLLRDALSELGELRAPRPFTLEAPPAKARGGLSRFEIMTRMGAVAAAVAFVVVLTGDFAGLGDDASSPAANRSAEGFTTAEGLSSSTSDGGGGAAADADDAGGQPAAAPLAEEAATDAVDAPAPTAAAAADDGGATTNGSDSALQADDSRGVAPVAPQEGADAEATVQSLGVGASEPPADGAGEDDGAAAADGSAADDDAPAPPPAESPGDSAAGGDDTAGGDEQVAPAATEVAALPPNPAAAPDAGTAEGPATSIESGREASDDGDGVLQLIELVLLVSAVGFAGLALAQRFVRRAA